VEIHVHQSQLNDEVSSENSSSTGSLVVSPEVSASLMKDKFLVTAITLEDDKEDYYSQSKLNELLKTINEEKKILNSGVPIVVKISPDIEDQEINNVCEVLLNNNIQAVIISNSSDSSRENLSNIQKHQKGGL